MTDRVGQHFGNYQLVKLLGQGGYARVYLGKHHHLNRYATLKVLNATIESGDEHKFLAEAQTLTDLQHPNIVHLLDFVIENSTPVLIMDYAPKGSLRQAYPQGTQMELATVVDFVEQIAAALQYAHNHNVIHRDVKPENILLSADDRLLLSDFGLSVLTPSSEQLSTQDPAGTPVYMAPEQLRGKPCFASDQYALAVMVYEWLCGERPFQGTLWEVWHQHTHTDPPPLRTIRPDLPLRLENVVLRALAKNPQDRFVSILAFSRAFAQASQPDTPIDEIDAQGTSSLQTISRPSPIMPQKPPSTLTPQQNEMEQMPTRTLAEVPPKPPPVSTSQNQNRVRMLRRLHRSYNELMSQSLQGATWLELGLADKPDAVQNAANLLLRVQNSTDQLLASGTSIIQAYDEAEHELLILGEPGAGKSTQLLNLAQQLLTRAEQDENHPLPVILPLSSWAVKRPPLQDWIAEQLADIYDVPRTLSVQWAQEDSILPLLDGLDEMEENAHKACIAAINTYHRAHLAPLVVCSRTTEYEIATDQRLLALQRAIVVQPLTHQDVDAYLIRAGQSLTALQNALKKNHALHDLTTTPLMLNILILTYQGTSIRDLSSRQSLLLQQVWDDYVQRMATRKGNSKRYPLKRTQAWLAWMARQMREHNQTVFYLEYLQPNWLTSKQQRIYTWLAVRLPAIFIGVLVSLLVYVFFFRDTTLTDPSSYFQYGIMGGLLGGLWRGSSLEKGDLERESLEEQRHAWRKRLIRRLIISVCLGLTAGLSFGFHQSSVWSYPFSQWQTSTLSYGVVIGLSALLLQYLLTAPFHPGASIGNHASQRWKRLVSFFQTVQGPRALLVAVITGLSISPFYGLSSGLRVGLSSGIAYGLISLVLNTQMEDIRPTERLSWSWKNLRRGLFNSRHLRVTALLTCISGIFVGLSAGLSKGLNVGLSIGLSVGPSAGLSYWWLLGHFQVIAQKRIENQDRRVANQGIHRSLRNSVIMGIIGSVRIGIIGILSYWLTSALNSALSHGQMVEQTSLLNYMLLLCISSALLIFLLTGGLAALRHYIIRLMLWRSHTFPGLVSQFLNDATARILLRRVGGGYSSSRPTKLKVDW